jgi:hypothetical protein
MSRTLRTAAVPRWALVPAVALVLAGCGGDDDPGIDAASPPSTPDAEAATVEPTPVVLPVSPSGPPPAALELLTPAAGNGPRPDLAWTPVPGAQAYHLVLYGPDGMGYWAWQGAGSSVPLGGATLEPGAPGPSLTDGMTWDVVAYDARGTLIAASGRQPIEP